LFGNKCKEGKAKRKFPLTGVTCPSARPTGITKGGGIRHTPEIGKNAVDLWGKGPGSSPRALRWFAKGEVAVREEA